MVPIVEGVWGKGSSTEYRVLLWLTLSERQTLSISCMLPPVRPQRMEWAPRLETLLYWNIRDAGLSSVLLKSQRA